MTGPDRSGTIDGDLSTDGGRSTTPSTHTVRLELNDEPGQLLAALEPIADNGGNLLSIYHERGNKTPRGRIPVEVDFEATEERFEGIVDALRAAGVNVMQAGTEEYAEDVTVVVFGHLIDTDLSDTLQRIEACASASVADVSLTAPKGTEEASSARLRLETRAGETETALAAVRSLADEKGLRVVEPLVGVDA
ncbi:amino acid-binding protein [Halorubrum sp. JWXQ-INN 858]|uniref:amino acid-binding protein n=1 Tax=Halorubrum sp. JWXQ-INN 858 TaxID=2690782 RepID=UPI001357A885|nr:amino acid-binding protein [Halorubrum sp. JWXQ-INN 858]MWV65892.1 amino acid-binding protein [Halorubrum sp. JWXQ-INN 858]